MVEQDGRVRVGIGEGERCPDYTVIEQDPPPGAFSVSVPGDLLRRYREAEAAYAAVQEELEYYNRLQEIVELGEDTGG